MPLARLPVRVVFSDGSGFPRNNQKNSNASQGLLTCLSGKLRSFQLAGQAGFMTKPTKITVETDSLVILQSRNLKRGWCGRCGAEAEMIAIESVGVITNLDRSALGEWLNSGALHRSQSADGSEQICVNSLLASVLKTKITQPPPAG